MAIFILRRLGVMILTALALTMIVFALTNLEPNLEKIAKFEGNARMTDAEVASWLEKNGYAQPMVKRYAEWLGLAKGWTYTDEAGKVIWSAPVALSRLAADHPRGARIFTASR